MSPVRLQLRPSRCSSTSLWGIQLLSFSVCCPSFLFLPNLPLHAVQSRSSSLSSSLFLFISHSISPCTLSVPFHLSLSSPSAYSNVLNKQTSSGWLTSPIYNSSQSNYSEDLWQTHEVCVASYREDTGEKEALCFNIMVWTWCTQMIPALNSEIKLVFMCLLLFLIESTLGKGGPDRIGRICCDWSCRALIVSWEICFYKKRISLTSGFCVSLKDTDAAV